MSNRLETKIATLEHKFYCICHFCLQYSPGVSVHPSGSDRSFSQCIDEMNVFHGDRQGKGFQVWVDRVSSSQIGSELWLVKFDKWESSAGEYVKQWSQVYSFLIDFI